MVTLITAPVALSPGRIRPKASTDWSGRPVRGSRAWTCRIAAPASAARRPSATISSGVTGRCGDIEGVWIAPVSAQLMMTLRRAAMKPLLLAIPG